MKKNSIKTKQKKKVGIPFLSARIFPLAASTFLLIGAFTLCLDPAVRVLRICFNGDPIERLKCKFNVDGVMTKWAYACWPGPNRITVWKFGISYDEQVYEIVRQPIPNHNISGGPLNIDGNTFLQGIGSHAPSKIAFDLQKKYVRFSCKVGLDKLSDYGSNHGVIFSLIADGKEIYKSPKLRSDARPYPIDCSVAGIKELVLFADNTQFDDILSNVDWVDLKFVPQACP